MKVRLDRGDFGTYLIEAEDGRDVLIQTDFDFPGTASTFGWSPCHNSTDGTIDCPDCGKTATALISAAAKYLDENIGAVVDDPGYFDN